VGTPGALVVRLVRNGPAHRAGIRSMGFDEDGEPILGDLIVAIDGKPVKKINDLFSLLERYKVGDTVKVDLIRQGQRIQKQVMLGADD
jgi:S1-C subfamily serine protease